jgi:hypothetical protein
MNSITKTFVIAAGALLIACAPSIASAERIYFLVGTRHIYRIGPDRDANLQARIEIEKTYADKVAADQETFQKAVDGGADKDKESEALNADLDAIAEDRDKSLGEIYERTDAVREEHPELKIEGDGPYQLMGINVRMEGETMVFVDYAVYAPWPGYVIVGEPYGGWAFGVVYEPGVFYGRYHGWHDHFYHGERFHGGFYGHRGPVHFAPRGFVDRGREGAVGRGYGGRAPASGGAGKYGGGSSKPAGTGKYGGGSATSTGTGKYGGGTPGSSGIGKYGGGSSKSPGTSSYSGGVQEKTPPTPTSPSGNKYGGGTGTSTSKYGGGSSSSTKTGTGTTTYKSPTGTSTGTGGTKYKTTTSTYKGTKVPVGSSTTKTTTSTTGNTGSNGSSKTTSTSKPASTPTKAPAQKSSGPKKKG